MPGLHLQIPAPPSTSPGPSVVCRHARDGEIEAGLRFILGGATHPASEAQVAEFMRFSSERGIDSGGLWVAEHAGKLLWAILPVPSAGKTVLIFAPASVSSSEQRVAAAFLTERVLEESRTDGSHLAQVLLEEEIGEKTALELYNSMGFSVMAELIYLQATPRHSLTFPPVPLGYSWKVYADDTHGEFARTIERTYARSLDCPALNGVRDIEDVIAGHKAAGIFDPLLWFLLCKSDDCKAGTGVGVLLLNRTPQNAGLELVYVGLAPESRGQDLGDLLMRQALAATANSGAQRLTLAVDSNNAPALKLYYRHGLKRWTTRMALMKDLRPDHA